MFRLLGIGKVNKSKRRATTPERGFTDDDNPARAVPQLTHLINGPRRAGDGHRERHETRKAEDLVLTKDEERSRTPIGQLRIAAAEASSKDDDSLSAGIDDHELSSNSDFDSHEPRSGALSLSEHATSQLPQDFDSHIILTENGERRLIPMCRSVPFVVPELAHLLHEERLGLQISVDVLTWNSALNTIIDSGYILDNTAKQLKLRLGRSGMANGVGHTSMNELKFVPNFSYPIAASAFYDLGACIPAHMASSPLEGSSAEGTEATQAHLIKELHLMVNTLRERNEDLEERLIPQLSKWLEEKSEHIQVLQGELEQGKEDIMDLKTAVDVAIRILEESYRRAWEVWFFLKEIRRRHTHSMADFANQAVKALRTGVKPSESDVLTEIAERNVRSLKENIKELVEMIERVRGK